MNNNTDSLIKYINELEENIKKIDLSIKILENNYKINKYNELKVNDDIINYYTLIGQRKMTSLGIDALEQELKDISNKEFNTIFAIYLSKKSEEEASDNIRANIKDMYNYKKIIDDKIEKIQDNKNVKDYLMLKEDADVKKYLKLEDERKKENGVLNNLIKNQKAKKM